MSEAKQASRTFLASGYDAALLFPVLFLVGIGIVMIFSASSALALKKFGNSYYFLQKQAVFALAGIVALTVCRHFPYRLYRHLTYIFLVSAFISLLAVHISGLGISAGGATRWLRIAGISFQPAEFARFSMAVYLAYSMAKKKEMLRDFSVGFLPHLLLLGVFGLLILSQPDFGSAVILAALTWIMLFIGNARLLHLISVFVFIIPFLYLFMISADYRLRRLISFLDPWQYPAAEGYQIIHSLMAFGTGGISGVGIGNGHQKLFYLPEPHTDFIFSVVGEELGLMGVLLIVCLYQVILWKGIGIARTARDCFGSYLAAGLTFALGLQVCVNMGVALGLLPTKGLTLPFLSYGGTSLLLNMISIGILMNISASRLEPGKEIVES